MRRLSFLIIACCIFLMACDQTNDKSKAKNSSHIANNEQNKSGLSLKNSYIPYRSDSQKHFAAYFELENTSQKPIKIINAYSPAFAYVMLHETLFEDGMAKMNHLESIDLNKGDTVHFKPKGKHVMLMQARRNLSNMEGIYLILELANGQKLKYEINFRKRKQ